MIIRHLGLQTYDSIWQQMRQFTQERNSETPDEIWVLEHYPVFTQGQAGKPEHLLHNPDNIPVVQSDRGGQITYHGPGQLMVYLLLELRRYSLGIRQLVTLLEQSVIQLLKSYDIEAYNDCKRPGVYVNDAKICSIGLRVRQGCCYHGIAFNIAMDLTPFKYINPCGYQNLKMIQMSELLEDKVNTEKVAVTLVEKIKENIDYLNTTPTKFTI